MIDRGPARGSTDEDTATNSVAIEAGPAEGMIDDDDDKELKPEILTGPADKRKMGQ